MSSDPFADLGRTVRAFALTLREVFQANELPAPGSAAAIEAQSEPAAGDWGAHPSAEAYTTVRMAAASCSDHLATAGQVLAEHSAMHSLYTLTRGAIEGAAIACYLTEPGISPLERARRHMNLDLLALREDTNMHRRVPGPEASAKIARHDAREDIIGSTAQAFGLSFTKPKGYSQAYIGDKPPPAMAMIEQCAPGAPALRSAYQLLSSVAHSQWHGHSLLLTRGESPAPGKVNLELNISPRSLAMHLMPGPLCGTTLAERLRPYLGWDTDDLNAAAVMMLDNWGRIAGLPRAGARLV